MEEERGYIQSTALAHPYSELSHSPKELSSTDVHYYNRRKGENRPLRPLTKTILLIVTIFRVVVLALLFWHGFIHSNRYTYWNYTIQTAFYALLSLAYIFRLSYLFHFLSVFLFPVVFGSVFLVFAYILIILQFDNGWVLYNASNLGSGTLDLGTIHTADQLIHVFTLIDFFIVLVSGYLNDARWSILLFRSSAQFMRSKFSKDIAFRIYYYLIPAVPMLIYSLFFNPFTEYPTGKSPFLILGIAIVVEVVFMTWLYESMTRHSNSCYCHDPRTPIDIPPFPLAIQQSALKFQ